MTPTAGSRDHSATNNRFRASLVNLVQSTLDDAKAEDVVLIDIREKSSLADYMVIASGRSNRHVGAIAEQLSSAMRSAGYSRPGMEGLSRSEWVLVDAGEIIVHLFRPEVREFYKLEKMWSADFSMDNAR